MSRDKDFTPIKDATESFWLGAKVVYAAGEAVTNSKTDGPEGIRGTLAMQRTFASWERGSRLAEIQRKRQNRQNEVIYGYGRARKASIRRRSRA